MEVREFRYLIVAPDVEELAEKPADIRAAYHAVNSVDSFAAHIFNWCRAKKPQEVAGADDDTAYREQLSAKDADFALLRDIAKAQKHVFLTRGKPIVSGEHSISARRLGWDAARWDEGRWDSPRQVAVETNSGELRVVEAVVVRALKFLDVEMHRAGIP